MKLQRTNRSRWSVWILLVLAVIPISGCGGCGDSSTKLRGDPKKARELLRKKKEEEERNKQAAQAKQRTKKKQDEARSRKADDQSAKAEKSATPPQVAEETEKPARPDDVADWRRDDYYSAKRDGDPRLATAVAWLGKHFTGKETAAHMLTRLLEWGVDDPFAEAVPRRAPESNPELTEALVAALAANDTPIARQTLERLVDGTLKTADPTTAAIAALQSLVGNNAPTSDEMLFKIATDPDGDKELRKTALKLVQTSASSNLRLRLAGHALDQNTSREVYYRLWDCLRRPKAENLAAQAVLYQSDRLSADTKENLERQFAAHSVEALGPLLGIPSEAAKPTVEPRLAAEAIWSEPLAQAVARRLRLASNMERGKRIIQLAATVPRQSLRVTLLQKLDAWWEEGPAQLNSLIAPEGPLLEPGFLIVVKKLPRKDGVPADETPSSGGGQVSARMEQILAEREARRQHDKIAAQWMKFSEELVLAMCRRFHAAAIAPSNQATDTKAVMAGLPLKPHPNAEPTAVYMLDWPKCLADKAPGATVSPLQVRYVRFEQKATPAKLLAYYRHQVSAVGERVRPYGAWFDALTTDKERGEVRSIDVLVTKPSGSAPAALTQDQQVIVEILTVGISRKDADD